MRAIWSVTVRQLLRGKVSTGFAFLSVLLSSVLLSAVLLGGDSLVYTLNVKYYSEFALVALAAVKLLLCVLLAGTALMIRGGFWLSLERRTRMLGQLASVGATPAQLRATCSGTPVSQCTSAPRVWAKARMPRSTTGSTSSGARGLNSNTVDRLRTAL